MLVYNLSVMNDDTDKELLTSNIPKLEEIYKLSIQQQQVRGFFTHLHNYLEVIRDDPKLNVLVWTLVIQNYNQDNPKHKFKGSIKKLAEGLTVGDEYQGYLENALDAHKGVTRAYYCWFFLFSAFDLFDMNPEPADLAIQETILKELSEGTKVQFQGIETEYLNIFIRNDDSENKSFRRSDYQLYLEVFHAWITHIANEDKLRSGNLEQVNLNKEAVTVEIKFIDNVVSLWLSNTGSVLLRTLGPDSPEANFMQYILLHQNVDIGRGTVQTKIDGCDNQQDLTELARYCGFDKTLKKMFFPKRSRTIVRFSSSIEIKQSEAKELSQKYTNRK